MADFNIGITVDTPEIRENYSRRPVRYAVMEAIAVEALVAVTAYPTRTEWPVVTGFSISSFDSFASAGAGWDTASATLTNSADYAIYVEENTSAAERTLQNNGAEIAAAGGRQLERMLARG